MKKILAALVLALPLMVVGAPRAVAAPNPDTCEGYNESRVFLEVQQWWMPPGSEDFGHVHLGMCFPRVDQKVSGTIHFDFKVQLHNNPGVLQNVRIHLLDGNGQNHQVVTVKVNQTSAQHCPTTPDQCTWYIPVDLPTTASTTDGYVNFRPAAIVMHPEHGGTKRFAGAAWPLNLANGGGRPVKNAISSLRTAGSSWYTGALYGEAEFLSPIPANPVSGQWTVSVNMHPGAGGKDTTDAFASIDPSFHAVPPYAGQVLLAQSGAYKGTLTIDTTQLSNGPHKLFLREGGACDGTAGNDCGKKPDGSSNNVATSYSVQVIPFTVSN